MQISVVIATANRSASLRVVLDALRYQTFHDFEVIVVAGPCQDDTMSMLQERASWLHVVSIPELNLSRARNLGIDAAAGEVVAFIDDDAIPEPDWLADLAAAYADDTVGGAGGLVYDTTGVNLQYRYAVCNRMAETDFTPSRPLDRFQQRGADPCLYLQGTNMSYRREVLGAIGGFDENIEYIYDDVDIAMETADRGWHVQPLDGAAVHHKVLPSALRRGNAQVTDPYVPVKNRTYFALRGGRGHRPVEDIVRSLTAYLDMLKVHAEDSARNGRFTRRETEHFLQRLEAGFQAGFDQGVAGTRAGRALAPAPADSFRPYPVLDVGEDRLRFAMVSLDYPPKPMGGIARYTVDLAQGIAAQGHQAHVVTQAEGAYRIDFEDGVWVHRYPEGGRFLPSLSGHPLTNNLAHVASVWRAVGDVHRRFGLDLVAGNVWLAEVLGCALDPRWPTVMTLSTPIRTIAATQPAVAAKPEVAWQVKLEDAALRQADQLHPLSQANLEHVRVHTPEAGGIPAEVIWLGMPDRAGAPTPPPDHDGVEILFVGRLEPRKGIDTLIEAARRVLAERPQARLRIVGADNPYASEDARPYRERVDEQLAAAPEIAARITFEGEVSEAALDDFFRGCDVFCAPSRYESFGLMNLEAMMFARPVISCRAGGITEVVADGETGLLVEPADAGALAEALRRLIDDADLRHRMGEAGRRRYETEFANEIAASRILDLFLRTRERVGAGAVSAAQAESAVRAGMAEVIAKLTDVDRPSATVDELLDPTAFPYDYIAAIERLRDADDEQFVAGLYRAILRREPDVEGLALLAGRASEGPQARLEVVRALATSDEATLLGVDTRFLERLTPHAPGELVRRVQDAFWRDDRTFADLLSAALAPPGARADGRAETILTALEQGADRHDALRELVESERRQDVRALLEAEFLTREELERRLRELAVAADAEFVTGCYRLLLGRDPEPEGAAGTAARLRRASRGRIVLDIAQSPEATSRGIDPHVVAAVASEIAELGGLAAEPALSIGQRIDGVPGGRRARQLGRRLLRDPRVHGLEQNVHRLHAAQERAAAEVHVLRREETQAVARMSAEMRELGQQVQQIAADLHGLEADLRRFGDAGARSRAALGERLPDEVTERLLPELPKPGTYGTYLGHGRILVAMQWGGLLLAPADDLSLTPELAARGIYEAPFTRYLTRTLRPGHKAVDVGANIGMYTVLMADWVGAAGHVLAYEPNPDVLPYLRENVAMNWVNDRVTIRAAGASDEAAKLTLYVTERFQGNSSIVKPGEAYFSHTPMDSIREVEIDTERLDEGAGGLGHIDIVKIDVEGAEHTVLRGMTRLFEEGLVDRVSFEVYRERMGEPWSEFSEILRGHSGRGWGFHDITDEGELKEIDLDEVLAVGRYSQIVMCAPRLRG